MAHLEFKEPKDPEAKRESGLVSVLLHLVALGLSFVVPFYGVNFCYSCFFYFSHSGCCCQSCIAPGDLPGVICDSRLCVVVQVSILWGLALSPLTLFLGIRISPIAFTLFAIDLGNNVLCWRSSATSIYSFSFALETSVV